MSEEQERKPRVFRVPNPLKTDQQTVDLTEQLRVIAEAHGLDRFEVSTRYVVSLLRIAAEEEVRQQKQSEEEHDNALQILAGRIFSQRVRNSEESSHEGQ